MMHRIYGQLVPGPMGQIDVPDEVEVVSVKVAARRSVP